MGLEWLWWSVGRNFGIAEGIRMVGNCTGSLEPAGVEEQLVGFGYCCCRSCGCIGMEFRIWKHRRNHPLGHCCNFVGVVGIVVELVDIVGSCFVGFGCIVVVGYIVGLGDVGQLVGLVGEPLANGLR